MTARTAARLVVALGVLLAGVAVAELPRLPKDLPMAKGPDSPGQVIFRHENHVDAARPDCTVCHPRRFSILGRSRTEARAAITHDAMEKGQACGACHGKEAFGFDECGNCHAE
jgi:c(7)-type cytochrome triheme protein